MAQQSSDMPVEDRTVIGFPISTEAVARFHVRRIDMTTRIIVGIAAVPTQTGIIWVPKAW